MNNFFKKCWVIILILFISFLLPFNVEAKGFYGSVQEEDFDENELISGDDVHLYKYIPVDGQDFEVYNGRKIANFEYYIIDSIDSKGNIKYKEYDFSKASKNVWYPDGYVFRGHSGQPLDVSGKSLLESFNSCQKNNIYEEYYGSCNIVLPAINGKISRWKFDSIKYGDKKNTDLCRSTSRGYYYIGGCDFSSPEYFGTYEFYSSYVYKFYEVPDEKPQLKVTCDDNKLSKGEVIKCKANFSYKYMLRDVAFNITSDKLKISNLNTWISNEIDNGYSMHFVFDDPVDAFKDNPVIATFDVSSDGDVNNVLAALKRTHFRYIDKLGENTLPDSSFDVDLENKKDNIVNKDNIENKDNIINPSTFRDNYYLVIGILIVGLICFIQMKSKAKSK